MKPHRMRITHDLIAAYGMLDKMHVLVRILLLYVLYSDTCVIAEAKTCIAGDDGIFPH